MAALQEAAEPYRELTICRYNSLRDLRVRVPDRALKNEKNANNMIKQGSETYMYYATANGHQRHSQFGHNLLHQLRRKIVV